MENGKKVSDVSETFLGKTHHRFGYAKYYRHSRKLRSYIKYHRRALVRTQIYDHDRGTQLQSSQVSQPHLDRISVIDHRAKFGHSASNGISMHASAGFTHKLNEWSYNISRVLLLNFIWLLYKVYYSF